MPPRSLSKDEILQISVADLEREIRHHNQLYWDRDEPEISDYDYDRLVERLRQLAPDSAALTELGAARFGDDVTHSSPMLSLDKCYDDDSLVAWAKKFDGEVVVTPKMDGIACSIRYDEGGRLRVAATRGSGTVGDDITKNALTIADIPATARPGRTGGARRDIHEAERLRGIPRPVRQPA